MLNEGRTILVTFLVSVTNYWRNAIKKGFILAHSLRVQSVMAGKTWQQQGEIAGLIALKPGSIKKCMLALTLLSP